MGWLGEVGRLGGIRGIHGIRRMDKIIEIDVSEFFFRRYLFIFCLSSSRRMRIGRAIPLNIPYPEYSLPLILCIS